MVSSESLAASLSGEVPKSIGRRAAGGVVWTTLGSLVNRLSGLVVFLVLARLLAPEEFGVLAAAMVFVALARILADAGLNRTVVQRPELRAAHLDSALLVTGGLGACLALLLLGAAPLAARFYGMPDLESVLMALAVVPLVSGFLSVPEAVLRRQLRFRSVAARSMWAAVLSDIVAVTLAFAGAGVWALVAQSISGVVIALLVLWASLRWVPGTAWERDAVLELVAFGSHVTGIALLGFVHRRAGDLIIGVTLGPVALGLFAVAMRILNLCLDVLVTNVQKVALPVFSRVAQDDDRLARAYLRATETTTLVASGAFVLVALFGTDLAPLVFGPQWEAAGPLMSILALVGPAHSMATFHGVIMLATGHSRLALGWTAVTAVVSVAGFTAASRYGVTTVAATYVGLSWVLLLAGLFLVRHVSAVSLGEQLRTLAVPVAGCVVMALVALSVKRLAPLSPVEELAVGAPAALAAYAAVTLPFRRALVRSLLSQLRPGGRTRAVATET